MAGSFTVSNGLLGRPPYVNLSQRLKQTFNPFSVAVITNNKNIGFSDYQNQQNRSFYHHHGATRKARKDFIVFSSMLPGFPLPSGSLPSSWKSWAVTIVLTVVLPFFTHKWGPLLQIKKQIDIVVETAEQIVDVVEIVAEKVEKVAEGIAHDLPEGGALRNSVDFVEDMAENIAKDAHLAAQFIDKVEEMEEKLESFMEPSIHQTKEAAKEASKQEVEPNEEDKELEL